ncbi:hypothetical protein BKA70DRAFT_1315445, partial [Coprinopsis sp. MPI-PUGE-AT-0042]
KPPSLPLEVIYRIIDEHWDTLHLVANRFGLLGLAQTCRALEKYCRPSMLRFTTLHDLDHLPSIPRFAGTVATPESFVAFMGRCPEATLFIRDLRLVSLPPRTIVTSETRRVKRLWGTKPWKAVLQGAYSNVTTLTLIVAWDNIPGVIKTVISNTIKQMRSLRSLEWKDNAIPLEVLHRCSPPNLKHLALVALRRYTHTEFETACNPAEVAHLDSLTLWSTFSLPRLLPRLFDNSRFDVSTLSHLQLNGPYYMYALPSWDTIILPAANNTIRCSMVASADMERLVRLKRLELIVPPRKAPLYSALWWLGKVFEMEPHRSQSEEIRAIILIQPPPCSVLGVGLEEVYQDHVELERWIPLRRFNILGFSTFGVSADVYSRHFVEWSTPRELPRFGGEGERDLIGQSYSSLWVDCSCSGWKG